MFGLNGVIPSDASASWGARLIFAESCNGTFRCLYDRQAGSGDSAARSALGKALNGGVLKASAVQFASLYLESSDRDVHTLYSKDGITVKASCNGSYGYIYVSAWMVG